MRRGYGLLAGLALTAATLVPMQARAGLGEELKDFAVGTIYTVLRVPGKAWSTTLEIARGIGDNPVLGVVTAPGQAATGVRELAIGTTESALKTVTFREAPKPEDDGEVNAYINERPELANAIDTIVIGVGTGALVYQGASWTEAMQAGLYAGAAKPLEILSRRVDDYLSLD